MKEKRKSKIWLEGIVLAAVAALFLFRSDTVWKWYLPYVDTANYQQMVREYDGFAGMPVEKALQLLTKDEIYVIVPGDEEELGLQEDADTEDCSVLCFPVQNNRSREECFLKGFLVDENGVIIMPVEIQAGTDWFFGLVHER